MVAELESLSFPLKHFFVASLAQPWEQLDDRTPRAVLNGLSGLDALLKLRIHVRAVYGPDAFGRWLEHRVLGMAQAREFMIVDDLLFQEDFDRFAHYKRTLIHIGKNPLRTDFVWLPKPDFVVGDGTDIEKAKAIVEKL
jgi:hypothetical protein